MTRCDEFYDKVRKDGIFCGMDTTTVNDVLRYVKFVDAHPSFRDFSEFSLQPLISVKDPEIQQKIIKKVENGVKKHGKEHGIENFNTEKKMKAEIARYEYVDQETPAEKELREVDTTGHLRKDHLIDFLEDTEAYVNRMYDRGRTEMEIRGWIQRAIHNCRRLKSEHEQLRTDYDKWVEITYTPEEIAAEEVLWKEQEEINAYLSHAGQ